MFKSMQKVHDSLTKNKFIHGDDRKIRIITEIQLPDQPAPILFLYFLMESFLKGKRISFAKALLNLIRD